MLNFPDREKGYRPTRSDFRLRVVAAVAGMAIMLGMLPWAWRTFLVPLGLPAAGFWFILGVWILIRWAVYGTYPLRKARTREEYTSETLVACTHPAAVWGMLWVCSLLGGF